MFATKDANGITEDYFTPLTSKLPKGTPIAVLESGWPAECGLQRGCPWHAGPLQQLELTKLAKKIAAKAASEGHPLLTYNWLFLNAENITLPTSVPGNGDFATISLRTASGQARLGLYEAWTTGWRARKDASHHVALGLKTDDEMSRSGGRGTSSTRWAAFVSSSGVLQLVTMMGIGGIPLPHIRQATAEISDPNSKVFRAMDDPLMVLMLVSMPLLSAILLGWLAAFLRVNLDPHRPAATGGKFAVAVWAATALHGIFIDFCTYRESAAVALHFAISSAISAWINGYMLAVWQQPRASADTVKSH
jgi:hypothetical protein